MCGELGSDCCRKEDGKGLLEMMVALGIMSFVVLMVVVVARQLNINSGKLKDEIEVLESLAEVEVFLRKEFQQLQFVPYCLGMLPAYSDMRIGNGVDASYREYLQESFRVLTPRDGAQDTILDLNALKGSGGATYSPSARKNISGITLGSEMLQVVGLFPADLRLQESVILGYLTPELVGVRRLTFYVTDCRSSMVLVAEREKDVFVVDESDYGVLIRNFDQSRLHIYVVKEYLVYSKIEESVPYFVIDFLDGQAFLRIPNIADLRVDVRSNGLLSVGVLAAKMSREKGGQRLLKDEGYSREIKNAGAIGYREMLIGLE